MVQIRLDDEIGNVETATIRTRYLADAAIGSGVTDDWGGYGPLRVRTPSGIGNILNFNAADPSANDHLPEVSQ